MGNNIAKVWYCANRFVAHFQNSSIGVCGSCIAFVACNMRHVKTEMEVDFQIKDSNSEIKNPNKSLKKPEKPLKISLGQLTP